MIDTDLNGQKKLKRILRERDQVGLTDWEMKFIESLAEDPLCAYAGLSSKQKGVVESIWEKYFK